MELGLPCRLQWDKDRRSRCSVKDLTSKRHSYLLSLLSLPRVPLWIFTHAQRHISPHFSFYQTPNPGRFSCFCKICWKCLALNSRCSCVENSHLWNRLSHICSLLQRYIQYSTGKNTEKKKFKHLPQTLFPCIQPSLIALEENFLWLCCRIKTAEKERKI